MQLHPSDITWGREKNLLIERGVIGLGDWKEEKANQQVAFEKQMKKGDIVAVKRGGNFIALTRVTGDYEYIEDDEDFEWCKRRRKIEILDWYDRSYAFYVAPNKTLTRCADENTATTISIKKWYKQVIDNQKKVKTLELIKFKHQIILQGPPGTGKTRLAKLLAEEITRKGNTLADKDEQISQGEYQIVQFHPAYSYEDFVRGIVAETNENGNISYKVENRVLAEFAKKAQANPNGKYVLIIDEINRANLPSVLGELIYALEYRGKAVTTMYELEGDRQITLPENLYIIGTMNTADRSVGHIDYAIRRRFAFVNVDPDINVIINQKAKNLFEQIDLLFKEYISPDFQASDVMIGHSYFIVEDKNEAELKIKWDYEIKPILREYIKDGILIGAASEKINKIDEDFNEVISRN
ncbi:MULTISPECIES: McrB family protein [unclassified Acinetobacter]|uniref:McrB family protein n=1 Tax=unclassified Acinetobacter TaxID=196816 RepID=UPI00211DB4EA|nr:MULTISPECIES: AAA family ATPase [unclassified Acinetobacter]